MTLRRALLKSQLECKKLKDENEDLEKRLEGLYEERQHIQNEVVSFNQHQGDMHLQLQESQDLLKQSEMDEEAKNRPNIVLQEKFQMGGFYGASEILLTPRKTTV